MFVAYVIKYNENIAKTNDINKLIIKNLIFIFYSVSSSGLPSSTSSISLKNAPSFKSY